MLLTATPKDEVDVAKSIAELGFEDGSLTSKPVLVSTLLYRSGITLLPCCLELKEFLLGL